MHRNLQNRANLAWLCILRIQLPQSSFRVTLSAALQNKTKHKKWIIIIIVIPAWFEICSHCFFILVSRNSQDVTRSALGEVWLWLVDLGLDNDRALPAIHAALDGTCDIHLQLPLLTAGKKIQDGERKRKSERESYWMLEGVKVAHQEMNM